MTEHVCLIDGSNMIHRAWAMARPMKRAPDGAEVGSVWLFGQMIRKIVRRMESGRIPPTRGAVFFDPPREDSWRRTVMADYKAHRPAMDPILLDQIDLMKELTDRFGLARATAPRHEADDLIAAYVKDARARGWRATILSSDKDLMQLVGPGVLQYDSSRDRWFRERDVLEKFGVSPERLGDFLALAGDNADGIPGVPGVGPVAAAALLGEFGSLAGILERSGEIVRPSWRRAIEAHREQARLSRLLVALDADGAPRPLSLDRMYMPLATRVNAALENWRQEIA